MRPLGYCKYCNQIKRVDPHHNCSDCIRDHPDEVYKKCQVCAKVKYYDEFGLKDRCKKCLTKLLDAYT